MRLPSLLGLRAVARKLGLLPRAPRTIRRRAALDFIEQLEDRSVPSATPITFDVNESLSSLNFGIVATPVVSVDGGSTGTTVSGYSGTINSLFDPSALSLAFNSDGT